MNRDIPARLRRVKAWGAAQRSDPQWRGEQSGDPTFTSPRDAVILPMIRRPAPERAMFPVEENGVDRAGGPIVELELVAHLAEFVPRPRRRVIAERQAPGLRLVIAE